MKKGLAWLLALILLLSGCGAARTQEEPDVPEGSVVRPYKIMEVGENGGLLLCGWGEQKAELVFASLTDAEISDRQGKSISAEDLRPGMVVDVVWDGLVAEIYPGRIRVDEVRVTAQEDDLVGLYLRVLLELWEYDSGLNSGVELLGLDFSGLTDLTEMEKEALAYLFSCDVGLGLQYVTGTWQELCDEGYIDGEELYWENGVLFSLSLTEGGESSIRFSSEKWRSGLGALFFTDCTARQGKDGQWVYELGGCAIA